LTEKKNALIVKLGLCKSKAKNKAEEELDSKRAITGREERRRR